MRLYYFDFNIFIKIQFLYIVLIIYFNFLIIKNYQRYLFYYFIYYFYVAKNVKRVLNYYFSLIYYDNLIAIFI